MSEEENGGSSLGRLTKGVKCKWGGAKWVNAAFQNLKLEKMKLMETARDG